MPAEKSIVMLITTWRIFDGRRRGILELLRQDGLSGPRVWAKLAWYAFGNPRGEWRGTGSPSSCRASTRGTMTTGR